MKITEQQLQFLYQIAVDSVKINLLGFFSYTLEQRVNVVNAIMNQQSGEIKDIKEEGGDEEPTLEVQYYKEAKKVEPPKKEKEYLKRSITLLRRWEEGASDGAGLFLLLTSTNEFLDEYDKVVVIK